MNDRGKKEGQKNKTTSILLVVCGKISFLSMALTIGLCHLEIETYILCCRKCKPPFYHMSLFSIFFLSHSLPLPTLLSVKQPNCNLRLPKLPYPKLLYTLKTHNLKKQKSVKLNASKMIASVLLR